MSIRRLSGAIGEVVGKKPIFHQNSVNGNDLVGDISNMVEKLDKPIIKILDGINKMVKAL